MRSWCRGWRRRLRLGWRSRRVYIRCRWSGRRRHGTIWGPILQNWPEGCLSSGRRRLRVLDSPHGGLKDVRLNGNLHLADLAHGIFGRVLGILGRALPPQRLGPVLLEHALGHPSMPRPCKGLGHNTAVASVSRRTRPGQTDDVPLLKRLVVLTGKIIRLRVLHGGQRLSGLDRFGQCRRRGLLDGSCNWGDGSMLGRGDGALLRNVLDARSSPCGQFPLPLHDCVRLRLFRLPVARSSGYHGSISERVGMVIISEGIHSPRLRACSSGSVSR